MLVYKNKDFKKWAKKQGIKDSDLLKAISEMNDGLFDANLGTNVYKKRLAYGSKGKRGGVRTILAFRLNEKAFFIYGFAKNEIENITEKDVEALKIYAKMYLNFNDNEIETAIRIGDLVEVKDEKINT